jgi:hypothetical protein
MKEKQTLKVELVKKNLKQQWKKKNGDLLA